MTEVITFAPGIKTVWVHERELRRADLHPEPLRHRCRQPSLGTYELRETPSYHDRERYSKYVTQRARPNEHASSTCNQGQGHPNDASPPIATKLLCRCRAYPRHPYRFQLGLRHHPQPVAVEVPSELGEANAPTTSPRKLMPPVVIPIAAAPLAEVPARTPTATPKAPMVLTPLTVGRVGERRPHRAAVLARLVLVSSRRHLDPCMRFSRTRLSDVLHRRAFGFSRHGLFGRGAIVVPVTLTNPSRSGEATSVAQPLRLPRLWRLPTNRATRSAA